MTRTTYVQDPKTGKLVEKNEYYANKAQSSSAAIHGFEEFKSPIDGRIIGDRRQLADHNRQHGVTNVRDYGDGYFERKGRERAEVMNASSSRNKRERVATIKHAMNKHGLR